ncbi:hypothetical protein, partial [Staphylococcus pseudintermedius]|uniref:hypothetical protein n=1 Tax=Staphylococcus pseudintermedius TaxID=283734 RepID=UPI001E418947
LTVPTTKPVTDFHRQDVTHAGRTEKKKNSPYPIAFNDMIRLFFLKNYFDFAAQYFANIGPVTK